VKESTDRLLDLLAREGPSLHALLARLTIDRHAAEDLMQELFVKADIAVGFRTAQNPAAYLRQSAIHLAFEWRRTRKRAEDATTRLRRAGAPGESSPAEHAAIEREQWQRILDGAQQLSGQAREVFVLVYLQQQKFEEIAQQMGKTSHQIRALASKAVAEVRATVKSLEEKEASDVRR